mgnify:CR=1 FL=1
MGGINHAIIELSHCMNVSHIVNTTTVFTYFIREAIYYLNALRAYTATVPMTQHDVQ